MLGNGEFSLEYLFVPMIVTPLFEVTRQELERADIYEVSDYKRVMVKLASGIRAWVYVHAATEVAL